jgi:hypothetical protein
MERRTLPAEAVKRISVGDVGTSFIFPDSTTGTISGHPGLLNLEI